MTGCFVTRGMNTQMPALAITAAVLVLAGCGSGGSGAAAGSSGSTTAPGTSTGLTTSTATSTTGDTTGPVTSTTAGTTDGPTGPAPTTTASSAARTATATGTAAGTHRAVTGTAGTCTTAHLGAALARVEGAAGSTYLTMRLTNRGTTTCTTYGYPGVSIVGDGNGTQIGAAAARDHTVTPTRVTLRPGGSTTFVVRLVQALNYPRATCGPVVADGFRIYPPDNTRALFLADHGVMGCLKTSVNLLTVRPVG